MQQAGRQERLRRYRDKHAGSYDRQMGFFDRHLFAGSRDWICSRARPPGQPSRDSRRLPSLASVLSGCSACYLLRERQ